MLITNQDIAAMIARAWMAIMAQRQEILRAFLAHYGCFPDEVEQVIAEEDGAMIWYVQLRKRQAPEGSADE